MNMPQLHVASDRRCYNGAFSSDLQRQHDSEKRFLAALQKIEPDYQCVYFPAEGKYLSFVKYNQLTDRMFESKNDCMRDAWDKLAPPSAG